MFPILQIGPLSFPAPEFILVLSVYLGLALLERSIKARNASVDLYSNTVLYSFVFFLFVGRIAYVAQHWYAFADHPTDVFSLNRDLFDPWMGLVAVILFVVIIMQRYKVPLLEAAHSFVPFLAIFLLGIDLSNVASGNSFGSITHLPWGVMLWGAVRHPVQVYTLLLDLVGVLWVLRRHTLQPKQGDAILWLLMLFSATRFLLQYFMVEGNLLPGGYREQQLFYFLILLGSIAAITQKGSNPNQKVTNNG